jgi:hypothetical protein
LYVKHTVGDVIVFDKIKDLGFVDISGICTGMEDPIGVNGEILPMTINDLGFILSSHGMDAQSGMRGKALLFQTPKASSDIT